MLYVCVRLCEREGRQIFAHALHSGFFKKFADLPALQTMSIQFSCLWLVAPSQKEDYVKCMDGERPKVLRFCIVLSVQLLYT